MRQSSMFVDLMCSRQQRVCGAKSKSAAAKSIRLRMSLVTNLTTYPSMWLFSLAATVDFRVRCLVTAIALMAETDGFLHLRG